jgi:ATP-dependent DNA ligase
VASCFDNAFYFLDGGEAVGQIEEDSLSAREVEESLGIRNSAGISDSELDPWAVGGAAAGNLDERRADVDSCGEPVWADGVRNRDWLYELKLDGYRALAVKTGGRVLLRSRYDNNFNARDPSLVEALGSMPDDTVIDGEVVALDEEGRPSFNTLQNHGSGALLHFFIFDLLILKGRDVMAEPLLKRRALIEKHVLPTLADPIRYSPIFEASLPNLIRSVKEQGLEGLVAKRRDSKYEPGLRSGTWQKMRVNRSREFVIAGYTPSLKNFDALIIGYYEGDELMYAARTRSGFTPASRAELLNGSGHWKSRNAPSRTFRRRRQDVGARG